MLLLDKVVFNYFPFFSFYFQIKENMFMISSRERKKIQEIRWHFKKEVNAFLFLDVYMCVFLKTRTLIFLAHNKIYFKKKFLSRYIILLAL